MENCGVKLKPGIKPGNAGCCGKDHYFEQKGKFDHYYFSDALGSKQACAHSS